MSSENPYAPGISPSLPQTLDLDDASQRCLSALKCTRPWVRFIGILTAIAAVLCGIASVVALFAAVLSSIGLLAVVVAYGGIAVVYGFAAKFLLFYAGAITRTEASLKLHDIAIALEHQKSFWKLVGICMICILVLYLLFIPIMLIGVAF